MISNSVDLPAPFGPMIPTSSPGATSNEIAAIGDDAAEVLGDAGDGQEAHGAVRAAARRRSRSPIHPTRPCGTKRTITISAQP